MFSEINICNRWNVSHISYPHVKKLSCTSVSGTFSTQCAAILRNSSKAIHFVNSLKTSGSLDEKLATQLLFRRACTSCAISSTPIVMPSPTRHGPSLSAFALLLFSRHSLPAFPAYPYGSALSCFLFSTYNVYIILVVLLRKVVLRPCLMCILKY